jgi:Helix-turn-helix of DDE superfamily endonuclease
MKYENLKLSSDDNFRRVTGVKRKTFETMLEILKEAHKIKKAKGGRPNKLSIENMLLMALEYNREYRTYLHIATSYGLAESNTFEAIKWVEDVLVKSKEFRLPGRKALLKSDNEFEVILIDATESPIQRPKKNKDDSIQVKRNAIL